MSSDPLAPYRIKPNLPPKEDPFSQYRPKSIPDQIKDPLAQYRRKPQAQNEESPLENISRQAIRTLSRVSEAALGAPRAAGEFLEGLVPEKALVAGAEKLGIDKGVKTLLETAKKYAPYKLFPKSEQVKELNKSIFGEKIEPKNRWEKLADDVVSDFTSLAIPIGGTQAKILKPFLTSLGGNLVSEGIGYLGGTPQQKTYGKLGAFVVGSMTNPKGTENLKNDLYKNAENNRPPDAIIPSKNLIKKINHLRSELSEGGSAESKIKSLKKLDELEAAAKSGNIKVTELEEFKKTINESLAGLYDDFKTNKPGRAAAKKNLGNVAKIVDDSLFEYGKINPAWEAFYRPANEIHGAIAQSHRARNFIKKYYKNITAPSALTLYGIEQAAGLGPSAVTAAGAGSALLTGELIAKAFKSPTIRKYYTEVINSALREDAAALQQNMDKLEKELKK